MYLKHIRDGHHLNGVHLGFCTAATRLSTCRYADGTLCHCDLPCRLILATMMFAAATVWDAAPTTLLQLCLNELYMVNAAAALWPWGGFTPRHLKISIVCSSFSSLSLRAFRLTLYA